MLLCINDVYQFSSNKLGGLTKNKVYDILSSNLPSYNDNDAITIIDDFGIPAAYLKDRFIPIESVSDISKILFG